ncbi:MAG TPA: hypothetical protein VIJ38_01445 [Acidobacteriaceae bacterium]
MKIRFTMERFLRVCIFAALAGSVPLAHSQTVGGNIQGTVVD